MKDEGSSLGPGHELPDPQIQALAWFRMATSPRDLPTPEEERDLHRRLMESDPVAPSEVCAAYIQPLTDGLRRLRWSETDEHLYVQAAGDAIFALVKKPSAYQPNRGKSLFGYLQMSAKGDLKNALSKRSGQLGKCVDLNSVELSAEAGNSILDVDDPLDVMIAAEEAESIRRELLPFVRDGLSAEECACLDLYLDGERNSEPYVLALRIESSPIEEQRHRVKQVKDMLKKRIERGRSRHGE